MTLQGRRVVVLGLGITGLSAARWAVAQNAQVSVADTRIEPPCAAQLARELPQVAVAKGPIIDATLRDADLVVISPGLSRQLPAVRAAVARGVEVVGDVELFARALAPGQKVIAITGSNGKTTVTALTTALLNAAGLAAESIGNIGEPVLDALSAHQRAKDWPDVFVIELSSFQLETTHSLRPVAATVLNVTDNHLDRYASLAEYARAKARIFSGDGEQILNRDNTASLAMRIPGRVVQTFGSGVPRSEDDWGLVDQNGDTWLARGGALLIPLSRLKLVGRHNALNALAALALSSTVAKIDRKLLGALSTFQGLPHRMERIAEVSGVLFINDSKATTVAATLAALDGVDRPAVLIAGGDGKGQDFQPLKAGVEAHCRAVVLLGRDAPQIAAALSGATPPLELAPTLENAVASAVVRARPGDVVLLSPACASLDMFRDYADRGDRFRAAVAAHAREATHA
jgi:UDP-N-acetylmuramoylalanine--D-glutamate ligase